MTARPSPSLQLIEPLAKPIDYPSATSVHFDSSSFFSWFMRKGYPQGAFWAIMITLVSVTNDILMRLLGAGLDVIQVFFFRFFFGILAVIPLMLSHGTALFKT